jgi:hypothetical protein
MTYQSWWLVLVVFELVGLFGQFQIGRGRWWGWAVVIGHSIPWFVVACMYGPVGAVLMPPLWWLVNGFNMRKWYRSRVF